MNLFKEGFEGARLAVKCGFLLHAEGKINDENLLDLTILQYQEVFDFLNKVGYNFFNPSNKSMQYEIGYYEGMADFFAVVDLYVKEHINYENVCEILSMSSKEIYNYLNSVGVQY